jgi:hypothetical protein
MMCFSNAAMRKALVILAITVSIAVLSVRPACAQNRKGKAAVVGSWEGESKCSVADSACHDEHVLYQISPDRKDPEQLNLDAYKIMDGAPEFMGTLACQYHSKEGALSCTANTSERDDWQFHVMGDAMSGRLIINGGTLYRRIALHRSAEKN